MHGSFLQGLRDAAILAIANDAMLRAAELAALDVSDFDAKVDSSGRLSVRKSKTDHEGQGAVRYLLAPSTVRHVQAWIDAAGLLRSGSLFCPIRRGGHCTKERLSTRSIRNIIARRAADAGVEGHRHIPSAHRGDPSMGVEICFRASDIAQQHIEDIRGARSDSELSTSRIIRAALQSFAERELERIIARPSYRQSLEHTGGHGRDGGLTKPAAVVATNAEDFRAVLLRRFLGAEEVGRRWVKILSRDLHREVGDYPGPKPRMSLCCQVMEDEMRQGDVVVTRPSIGYGARFTIRYQIPRPI